MVPRPFVQSTGDLRHTGDLRLTGVARLLSRFIIESGATQDVATIVPWDLQTWEPIGCGNNEASSRDAITGDWHLGPTPGTCGIIERPRTSVQVMACRYRTNALVGTWLQVAVALDVMALDSKQGFIAKTDENPQEFS